MAETYQVAADGTSVFGTVQYGYYLSGAEAGLLWTVTAFRDSAETEYTTTAYTYTADGWVDTITVRDDDSTVLQETKYYYDSTDTDHMGIGVPTAIAVTAQDEDLVQARTNGTGNYPEGMRATEYVYDAMNRMVEMIEPPASGSGDRYKTQWVYTCDGPVEDVIRFYGSGSTWKTISKTRNIYAVDGTGRLVESWVFADPTETPDPGDPPTGGGLKTSYTYYDDGKRATVTSPLGQTEDYKTEYVYDDGGRLASTRFYSDTETYDAESYTYYPDGQRATVTNARGYVTGYGYNEYNLLWTVTQTLDPEGTPQVLVTEYAYDEETRQLISETNPAGEVVEYTYDDYGRRTTVTVDPDGLALTMTYDYDDYTGELTSVTDPNGNVTEYVYDVQGRQTTATYADDSTTMTAYTPTGSVESVTTALGATTYTYDELDRVTTVTDPASHTLEYTYDGFTINESAPYVVRTDALTDPDEKVTESDTDTYGRLRAVRNVMSGDDIEVEYSYDANGNMTSLTDGEEHTTTFAYDHRGRLTTTTFADATTLEYRYDATGNLLYRKDRNWTANLDATPPTGDFIEYGYDELDRLELVEYPNDGTVDYAYDDVGRLESVVVTNASSVQESSLGWSYDAAGRVAWEKQRLGTEATGDEKTVGYAYDDVLNRATLTYPGNKVITLVPDVMNRVEQIKEGSAFIAEYTYNAMGQPTRLDLANGTFVEYDYDAAGRLEALTNSLADESVLSSFTYTRSAAGDPTKITYEDGRYRDYAYDDAHRLTSETHKTAGDVAILMHAYTYDKAGNRATKVYDGANTVTYTTNALNELVSTTGLRGLKIDVAGALSNADDIDRVEVTPSHVDEQQQTVEGTTVTASVRLPLWIARGVALWDDDDNEVAATAYDTAGNPGAATPSTDIALDTSAAETFVYDDAGHLVQDAVRKYIYNDAHRLIEVTTLADVPIVEFMYDAIGRRIEKVICDENGDPLKTIRYVYDGINVIEEYVWTEVEEDVWEWILDGEYVHGIGIDNVLTLERDENRWWYCHDGLGSVTELLDEDGALAQAYEYDAWGVPTIYNPADSTIRNPYLYTNREWDVEIGLYYYRSRYYDPWNGRWTQADLIGYAGGANLYAYVAGTPTTQVDPLGLWGEDIHRDLTAMLARWAGFTLSEGYPSLSSYLDLEIGEWAYAPDMDERAAVAAYLKYEAEFYAATELMQCVYPDVIELGIDLLKKAERDLREASKWHFPLSANGSVERNSGAARAFFEEGIRKCNLQKFAEGLHPLQDSWSHRGKPSMADVTGHPWSRGGPASHKADIVDLWHADVREVGLATYDAMLDFLGNCGCIKDGPYKGKTIRDPDSSPTERTEVKAYLEWKYPGPNKGL